MVISIGNVQIVGGHMNRTISATIHLWQPKRCQKERSKPQTVIKHDQIISNYVYIVPCLSIRGLHYIPKIWFLFNMNQPQIFKGHFNPAIDFREFFLPRAGWEHSEVWMLRTEAIACDRFSQSFGSNPCQTSATFATFTETVRRTSKTSGKLFGELWFGTCFFFCFLGGGVF